MLDCGELKGDDYAKALEKAADITGDPYEDYPDDQAPEADYEWKGEEVLEIATKLKDLGNTAFRSSDLHLALAKYAKALRYLHEYPVAQDSDSQDLTTSLANLKIQLYSNSAQVHIKLKQYSEAVEEADKALGVSGIGEKDKAKALYRRALAKVAKKGDDDAVRDLEEADKLVPGDAAVIRELHAAKKRVKERREKEKKVYANAFNFDD